MTATIVVKNFVQVPFDLSKKHGAIPAHVAAIVYYYASMSDGVCRAAQSLMAKETGMSRKTINTHLGALCKKGVIEKVYKGGPSRPCHYKPLFEFKHKITAEMSTEYKPVPNAQTPLGTDDTEKSATPDSSVQDVPKSIVQAPSTEPVQNISTSPAEPDVPKEQYVDTHQEMITAICTACGYDPRLMAGRVAKPASELRKSGYTAKQVLDGFYADGGFWKTVCHWGRQGQLPRPAQIKELIQQAVSHDKPLSAADELERRRSG